MNYNLTIEERFSSLNKLRHLALSELKKAPEGCLKAVTNKGSIQYFCRKNPKDVVGVYISKKNLNQAKALAQKEYNKILIKTIDEELAALERYKNFASNNPCQVAMERMNPKKVDLVTPQVLSDEEYLEKWKSIEYEHLGFAPDDDEHYTDGGVRVRSKTELIIGNMLEANNVPYHYEKPIMLGRIKVHPDFTLMDLKNRKEVYWEHLGMMDNPNYCESTMKKMRSYEKAGIYTSDRLIITMETGSNAFQNNNIRELIKKFAI